MTPAGYYFAGSFQTDLQDLCFDSLQALEDVHMLGRETRYGRGSVQGLAGVVVTRESRI